MIRGAGTLIPAMYSGVPFGASPSHKKAGRPGCRPFPKTWRAVSHVRVRGEHTTRSNAVNDRPPEGRVFSIAFNFLACSMPTSVRRAS